jgi:hypothetical protein
MASKRKSAPHHQSDAVKVSKEPDNAEIRKAQRVFGIAFLLLVLLRFVAAFFPKERLWGLNHLAYFPKGINLTLLHFIFIPSFVSLRGAQRRSNPQNARDCFTLSHKANPSFVPQKREHPNVTKSS